MSDQKKFLENAVTLAEQDLARCQAMRDDAERQLAKAEERLKASKERLDSAKAALDEQG